MTHRIRRRRSRGSSPEPAAASLPDDDDMLREILLRLPPHPSSLPHASAVCKRWLGLVTDPKFHREFYTRHRKPPLLGFFHQGLVVTTLLTAFLPWTLQQLQSARLPPQSCPSRRPQAERGRCVQPHHPRAAPRGHSAGLPPRIAWLLGYDEDTDALLLLAGGSVYKVQLKLLQSKKLYETHNVSYYQPFKSFSAAGTTIAGEFNGAGMLQDA